MAQKIIVTTSPWKNYENKRLMLSVCMHFQIDGGGTLTAYPDLLQWMERVEQALFTVQWNNDAPKEIKPLTARWDKELYKKLFTGTIRVQGFSKPDVSKMVLKSYPASHLNTFILDAYKEVGNLKTDVLPKASFYTKDWKKLEAAAQTQLKVTEPLTNKRGEAKLNDFMVTGHAGKINARQQVKQNRFVSFNPSANPSLDFGQFHHFHAKADRSARRAATIPKPDFEYHDILSILTSYPLIMRKLALVIDFELPASPAASTGTVRILPANLGFVNEVQVSCPATKYMVTANGFFAEAKSGSFIEKGMLKVNTSDFSVVQIDTDGAAMKLAGHADSVNKYTGLKLVEKSNFIPFVMTDANVAANVNLNAGNANAANTGNKGKDDDDDDDDRDEGLPSLRSAGIGIIKNGLAEILYKKLNNSVKLYDTLIKPELALNNVALMNKITPAAGLVPGAVPPGANSGARKLSAADTKEVTSRMALKENIPQVTEVLYADDLVHGYRMDIAYDAAGETKWYSLHKRKNKYAFVPFGTTTEEPVSIPPGDEIDEGCIHLSLAKDENDEDPDDEKVNEVIARWEGWSLSVPRPGKALNNEGKEITDDPNEERKKYKIDKDSKFRLQVETFPAPKTLPVLRFGKTYKLKIRTVDICGNGLPVEVNPENAAACVKSGIKYQRFEPLPTPVLHAVDEVANAASRDKVRERDGESLEHMVIRSNAGDAITPASYEAANPTHIYNTTNLADKNAVNTLQFTPEAQRHVVAPRTPQIMAELHGMFDTYFRDKAGAAQVYKIITERDAKEIKDDGTRKAPLVAYNKADGVKAAYLVDPLAAGVILTMKSDTSFETTWKKGVSRKFSFYFDAECSDATAGDKYTVDQWLSPKSFMIKLVHDNATKEPFWDRVTRVLTIWLPKSAQIEIKYASFWRPEDIERFSALHPVISRGNNLRSLEHARKGVHWMFSPWRVIRLTHAVQQPLAKPQLDKTITINNRNYEDTFTNIATKISVHGSSTDKVDIEAAWKETIDDLSETAPKQMDGKTHVHTLQVKYTDKELNCLPKMDMVGGPSGKGTFRHPFNDTKHRMVNYTPVATTRYREYFTGIIETGMKTGKPVTITQTGDSITLNVLNSARPGAPVVDYVVPSFNWVKANKGNEETHLRTGNIRVYLQRPWYGSGDDERIAVILPPKGTDPVNNPVLKKYCTVWGKDPVFMAPDLNNSNYPQLDHFPFGLDKNDPKLNDENFAKTVPCIYDTVKLAEEPNVNVMVAAYKVLFDVEKQLYYADIPINIGFAYFPFVRLSLARYQKHSLRINGTDCCMGNSVQADWMQVVPARYTGIYFKGGKNNFEIALRGVAPFTRNPDSFPGYENSARVRVNITVENTSFAKTDEAFISINDRQTRTLIWTKQYDLTLRQLKNGNLEFVEKVELPGEWSSKPFRVVIREYELHEFDPLRAQEKAFTNPKQYHEYGERLVFMDVFEVNGSV